MISTREKTASASESLANNLAADAADGEVAVHGSTMAPSGRRRQGLFAPVWRAISVVAMIPRTAWLIIINVLGLFG
jgi:hypothetical protein